MSKISSQHVTEAEGNAQSGADDALVDALLTLRTRDEMRAFLTDLCTPREIEALQERWRIVQLLARGDLSYRDINAATGASTTTIGRVARFLLQERHRGYHCALERLEQKNNTAK